MELGGIAIAALVSLVVLNGQARSQTQYPVSATSLASRVMSPPPDSTLRQSHPQSATLYPVLFERTPALNLAQHQSSHHLRELIRRYNSDLSSSEIREITHWTEFYSRQYGLDPRLVAGLVARESGFDPKARSRTGARGLGQISAALGKDLGIRDRYDIQENLEGTTRWIRTLYDTWRADGIEDSQAIHWSLASYRQGLARTREVGIPANVARYINEVYDIANGMPNAPTN